MLTRHVDIARHVRELTIRLLPEHAVLSTNDRQAVCTAVVNIASSKALDALRKFVWDADELPCDEDMWFALRVGYVISMDLSLLSSLCSFSCPQLRFIGASFGSLLPNLNSHVSPEIVLLSKVDGFCQAF